jgi:hypothetical protein
MQQISHNRLQQDLAIWLRLVPQHVRRGWAERNTHGRDAAADAIAKHLTHHLRHHDLWAPDQLSSGVPLQPPLPLEPSADELDLDALASAKVTSFSAAAAAVPVVDRERWVSL